MVSRGIKDGRGRITGVPGKDRSVDVYGMKRGLAAVVAIGVTFAAVQVRHEVLTRRLQGKSAIF